MRTTESSVERVFHAVADLTPTNRDARLAELCGEDVVLRGAVERLLAHDAVDDGFLDRPALGERIDLAALERPAEGLVGRRIGAYRIVEHLATGGMGIVFKAVRADDQYEKTVAIKLIRHAVTDSDVRRFRRERQTLADLDHPNIARLLDGGVASDGLPYLVMEFVTGDAIDAYCESRGLGVRDRLALFLAVCDAVNYSHTKLIVHRDLKPCNILVTPNGVVKLLDFGIAHVLDGGVTFDGGGSCSAFTPEHASPEQLDGGPITTATDVYTLGLLLYRLLAGRGPFVLDGMDAAQVRETVATRRPPPPSTTASLGRRGRDLDAIALRAIRRDPDARYPSVDALRRDVRAFLERRPVSAREGGVAYRARRFVGRNRARVVAAGLFAATAAAGVYGTFSHARDAARERDTASAAFRFLDDVLSSGAGGYTVGDAMARAAARMPQELGDEPRVRSVIHTTIARVSLSQGRHDDAITHFRAAIADAVATGGADSPFVLERTGELAVVLHAADRLDEAESVLTDGLAACRRVLGPDHLLTAQFENNLAATFARRGALDAATELYAKSLETRVARLGAMHLVVAETRANLAGVAWTRGDVARAITEARAAQQIRRARLDGSHPLVLRGAAGLATMLTAVGDDLARDEAEALLRASVERARLDGGDDVDLAPLMVSLGSLYVQTGRAELAEPFLDDGLRAFRTRGGLDDPRVRVAALELVDCWMAMDRVERAERLLATVAREAGDADPMTRIAIAERQCRVLVASDREDEAEAIRARIEQWQTETSMR